MAGEAGKQFWWAKPWPLHLGLCAFAAAVVLSFGNPFETQELQFRAEFFNIFNTPQFNLPGSSIASPANFGVSTGTLTTVSGFGTQRQIQFGLGVHILK